MPKKSPAGPVEASLGGLVAKIDEDRRLVWAWGSVIEENGRQVVDKQGDVIEEPELVSAAHGFMRDYRVHKAMHAGEQVGEVVESVVLTKDLQAALGVELGKVGWLLGIHVPDDDAWGKWKDGTYRGLSIGGTAVREEIPDAA